MRLLVLSTAAAILATGCLALGTIQEQMGPQTFSEPNVPIAGGKDPEVFRAVKAAVSVAEEFGFRHDASRSRQGRVDVQALWKGQLVTLKMRYERRDESALYNEGIYITSSLTQSMDVMLERGGQKLERLFYTRLYEVTAELGLEVYGDPNPDPQLD